VLERIAQLAIPPAWREVWICMDPRGHLQATGVDAAGRKQYLYHEQWRAHRDRQKFDSMIAFGHALPKLRRRVTRDLRAGADGKSRAPVDQSLSRERVLAGAVRLLDVGFFRIGSEDYAERNESYGLTTMLRKHVTVEGSELIFDFPAKSGQRRVQAIADADAVDLVSELKRRRSGKQLLAWREDDRWSELHAEEVNEYVKRVSGGDQATVRQRIPPHLPCGEDKVTRKLKTQRLIGTEASVGGEQNVIVELLRFPTEAGLFGIDGAFPRRLVKLFVLFR